MRTRWVTVLVAALIAGSVLAPVAGAAQPDPAKERKAEVARVLEKLRGETHVHGDGATHQHAGEALSVAELAVLGLRPGRGPCTGMFELNGKADEHACSHGPDPAPARPEAEAAALELAAAAPPSWATPTKVPCYTTGPYVQVLWVYTGTSRLAQFAEHVRRHIAAMDLMFDISARAVNGGDGNPARRHIRWAHDANCKPTIVSAQVSAGNFGDIFATKNELQSKGIIGSTKKYIAFLDQDSCYGGVAELAIDERASQSNYNNQGGSYGQMFGCLTEFAPYWDGGGIAAHELMHTLGAVGQSAPHATNGHCWDDEPDTLSGNDIMCYDDGYPGAFVRPAACPLTTPETFDCRKDDYFNPNPPTGNYLKTHWNTASNKFMATVEPPSYYTIPVATASLSGGGGYIGGGALITATATPPPGLSISQVEFRVNGEVVGTDSSSPYAIDLDTFAYTNLANIKVTATPYDSIGYPGVAASATYIVANPQVHLDSPTEFSINSPKFSWTAKAKGFGDRTVSKVQLIDADSGDPLGAADTTAPYGGSYDFSGAYYGGSQSVRVALDVTDSSGVVRRTTERTVFLTAGTVTGPFSTWQPSPTILASGAQKLGARVIAPPTPSIAKVEFRVNGAKVGEDATAPYLIDYTATAGVAGTLVARAIDAKGYAVDSEPTYFYVSGTGLSGSVTSPAANATISGSSVTVNVTPSVPGDLDVSGVAIMDGSGSQVAWLSAVDAGNPDGPWTGTIDTTWMDEGWNMLSAQVQAYDASFAYVTVQGPPIAVKVAKSTVTLSITAPADGAKVKQTVNVTASASGGSVNEIEFYAGDQSIGYDWASPFTIPWDTMQGSDGTVRVTARAYGPSGYITSAPRFYSVRNLYAWMAAPTPGQTISGTFTLKGGGRCDRDCALETATFFVDGKAVNYDRAAPYQFALDTTKYADGPHTFAITITTNDYRAVSSAIYPMTINN